MTDTPDTGDLVSDILTFALVATVTIGATLVGVRWAERVRQRDNEKKRER